LSEQQLIEAIVRGEPEALEQFYALHSPRAWAIALRVLRDPAEAEEVLQDTFIEIWRSATRYDPRRAEPERWVATIVRTRAIDRLRRRDARDRALATAALEPQKKVRVPDDQLVVAQTGQVVREALSKLPDEQRKALELAYFEGLSQVEIAERTATPLGTVKTRMRLGMLKLADALERP
jgi:RNA polymerase sigma-70 factor, ECF subfamily